jgi:hypothetical protein
MDQTDEGLASLSSMVGVIGLHADDRAMDNLGAASFVLLDFVRSMLQGRSDQPVAGPQRGPVAAALEVRGVWCPE